jgi:sec-independent protein translocase protein TatC
VKPLIEHLDELRSRLIVVLVSIALFFLIGLCLSSLIIETVRADLILYPAVQLIVLTPLEFLIARIKTGVFVAVFLSLPVMLYEGYLFLRPALKPREKHAVALFLPGFIALFTAGAVFAYFIFLPLALFFLARFAHTLNISNLWGLSRFLGLLFMTVLGMGIIFQLPLLVLVLSRLRILTSAWLSHRRKHVYVVIFILAALITPPDVITQVILALPVILLFEMSVLLARVFS